MFLQGAKEMYWKKVKLVNLLSMSFSTIGKMCLCSREWKVHTIVLWFDFGIEVFFLMKKQSMRKIYF